MKLTKLEAASILITLLTIAVMTGFFLGSRSAAEPMLITSQYSPSPSAGASLPPSPSGRLTPEEGGTPGEDEAGDAEQGEDEPDQAVQFPIDINTATAEQFQALPGIGESRAKAIVDYRAEHGPFTYVEDLRAVSGIGAGILEGIIDYVTVGGENDG